MNITTVGIDLAKNVFSLHGVDGHGKTVLKKTVSRGKLLETMANLPRCMVGMEACTGAHHWARHLTALGFEAYIRGEWLSQCASDLVIEAFLKSKEPPRIDCLLAELEMLESFNQRVLSQIKEKTWKSMCSYTHTGGLHVQRWNTEDGIEANYSRDEILEIVKFSEIIASLSVIGVARLANNDALAVQTLESFKKRVTE